VSLTEFNGLPAHVLLVHVIVVLVPLTAILLLLSVFWPAARRRIGAALPVLAFVTLGMVPVTTHAGGWLQARVPPSPLVSRHADLGGEMLPWAGLLFLVCVGVWIVHRRLAADAGGPLAWGRARNAVSVAVLALAVSAGSLITVYRIGDSGAKAAWDGRFTQAPQR
jgi:hypothetical protein